MYKTINRQFSTSIAPTMACDPQGSTYRYDNSARRRCRVVNSQQPRKEEKLINKNIVERRQRLLMTTFELATGMFSFFLQSI